MSESVFPLSDSDEVNSYVILTQLSLAFQKLGYSSVASTDQKWLDIKRVLIHVGISKKDDAYKVYQLIPLQSNPAALGKFPGRGKHILYDVVVAVHWYGRSRGQGTVLKKDLQAIAKELFCNQDETKDSVRIYVGEIPPFKGRFSDWPDWKAAALAVIKISGLHSVVTDPIYAISHPQKNAVLHGMLTLALTKGRNPVSSLVFVGTEDDGYKAWKNLQEYFEKGPLLRHMFELVGLQLETLKCNKIEDLLSFTNDFLHCHNQYTGYTALLADDKANSDSFQASRPINNWATLFLDKLTDSTLQTLKVSLKDDLKGANLWDSILLLRENLLKSNSIYRQKELTLFRAPTGYEKFKGEEDKGTKSKAGNPTGKPAVTKDSRYQKLVTGLHESVKTMEDGPAKDAVYKVINKAKDNITSKKHNHRSGGKRKEAKKRELAER
jgi:hypothetical protein